MIKRALHRLMPERLVMHLQAADHFLRGEPELRLLPWFRFEGAYYRFSQFNQEIHANRRDWGVRFIGNNVIFMPVEKNALFLT